MKFKALVTDLWPASSTAYALSRLVRARGRIEVVQLVQPLVVAASVQGPELSQTWTLVTWTLSAAWPPAMAGAKVFVTLCPASGETMLRVGRMGSRMRRMLLEATFPAKSVATTLTGLIPLTRPITRLQ